MYGGVCVCGCKCVWWCVLCGVWGVVYVWWGMGRCGGGVYGGVYVCGVVWGGVVCVWWGCVCWGMGV